MVHFCYVKTDKVKEVMLLSTIDHPEYTVLARTLPVLLCLLRLPQLYAVALSLIG